MDSPSTTSVNHRKPATMEGSPNLRAPSFSCAHGRDSDEVVHVLDERRQQALRDVDEAPYGSFHARVVIVAGVGFMAEAYDVFAISIASNMLGFLYGSEEDPATGARRLSPGQDLELKIASSVGTLFGQLIFGWAADILGRRRMYGYELVIITVATFTQALAGSAPGLNIIVVLMFWRFIMGLGVGGDYPLSAVITSEFSSTRIRGRLMTAVFACQGWGNLLASIVALIVVSTYRHQAITDINAIEPMWRLLIGLGCVPGVVAMYFRLTIPETPRFTMDIERNVQQASNDIQNFLAAGTYYADPDAVMMGRPSAPAGSRKDFFAYLSKWKNARVLLGTSWSWFAAGVAFYGLGLNSGTFGTLSLPNRKVSTTQASIIDELHKVCVGRLILAAGLVPGYWASFFVIDRIGRKPIQYIGFTMLTVILCIMGFAYDKLIPENQRDENQDHPAHPAFVFLFCLANFFQNFGPNVTTFVIPGELFPTRYRTTSFGISAACGKLGAVIAQVTFTKLKRQHGTDALSKTFFAICALFMFTGIFSTFLLPETKGVTLEDLSSEDKGKAAPDSVNMTTLQQVDTISEQHRFQSWASPSSPHSFGSARP